MMYSRLIALVMVVLLVGIPAAAQDGYPLPENLPTITPENAAQVTELARVGGVLPGDLVWSPDGSILAAGTSAGVKLYDADDLTAAPRLIPGGKDIVFNPTGTILVSGGQIWNTQTGNAIASIGESDTREFSPSGNILVTSHFEEGETRVFLWDAQGKPLATLDTDSYLGFDGAAFNADESMTAIKLSNFIQLWNVETGQLMHVLQGVYPLVGTMAFSANERYLIVETYDDAPYGGPFGDVELWDTHSGELVQAIDYVFNLTVHPDGSMIFYQENQGVGGILLDSLQSFQWENFGYQLAFSADGELFAADYASEGQSGIAIWNISNGQPPHDPSIVIEGQRQSFVLSPDSRLIAIVSSDIVHIWDIQANTEKIIIDPNLPRQDYTWRLCFNDTSDRLLISYGNTTQTWDVTNGELLTNLMPSYTTRYNLNKMLTAEWVDGQVQVMDLNSGTETMLPVIEDYYGYPVALNASQNKVAFSGDKVQLYDLITGTKNLEIEITPRNLAFTADASHLLLWENVPSNPDVTSLTVHNVAFPFDEYKDKTSLGIVPQNRNRERVYDVTARFLAWATWDANRSTEKVYDLKTGELVACWIMPPNEFIESNTFTPDGKFLMTSSYSISGGQRGNPSLTIWDIYKIGNQLGCAAAEPHSTLSLGNTGFGDILDLVFSADGEQLALSMDFPEYGDGVHHNYVVYLLPTEDLLTPGANLTQETTGLVALQSVYQPQFSPDGQFVLTARSQFISYDDTHQFQLWNVETGETITTFAGDGAAVFSGDGALVVTHGEDGISLWEVDSLLEDASPEPLLVLPDDDYAAVELAFSPDNSRLYARWSGGVIVYGVQDG
jgi:WD40 repeat protein